ncbi:hypothetical protein AXG93_3960s1240 [Marchantia polymorpha subsp. ruderalis]|uniref:DUF1499 domain-containing protein n=1 Tax=Marchantia polymorpha subsp. ruderalis TaxID=1480154 RepID=A0A176VIK1_MARPO|nr:hypothetical protein AXG93_3960s1240 [Marchantia polymorpha subsp. ruderalis]
MAQREVMRVQAEAVGAQSEVSSMLCGKNWSRQAIELLNESYHLQFPDAVCCGVAPPRVDREIILRTTNSAAVLAFVNFRGERPSYLGVQKGVPSLALCPATPNCISTAEEINDPGHYVPPWTYNPEEGRGRRNPASKEQAMQELIEVVEKTKPDNFTPRIVKRTEDYIYVEYESPLLKFIDDVEFWFPPGGRSLVEYRSASRVGSQDFNINRKRIKALRQALEKKGWKSVGF